MKAWYAFWIGLATLLGVVAIWRNTTLYPRKPAWWKLLKSGFDLALIISAAIWLPPLLVAWCVMWATKPIKSLGIRVTLSVLIGTAFGVASNLALEFLMFLGIFAIDAVTGKDGFGKYWAQAKRADQRRQLEKATAA